MNSYLSSRIDFAITKNMKRFFTIFLLLMAGGCAYRNPLSDMNFQTTAAPPYVIANWYKIEQPGQTLKVYIEGDGHSFDNRGMPTDNPTPKSVFMRELAAGDPSPNVAYVARPCQFLQVACKEEDWTDGRFSENVVRSMDTAVAALMKKAQAKKVVLVGFSGGAQVAGLVAVRHPERVQKLITIAGVLDQAAWTKYHGDAPLTKSINLKDYQDVLKTIPQVHYAGEKDHVVPPELIQAFVEKENIVIVPKAGHGDGFVSIYDDIYGVR